jgi:putative transposase
MLQDHNHLNHATWECKYHVVHAEVPQECPSSIWHSLRQVIGYLKGKSSIWIAQNVERKVRNFWARGYFVSTVGRNDYEEMIRAYIRNQEMTDKQLDQLQLKLSSSSSPIFRPRILYNRLWRFPVKPPALLGVTDFLVEFRSKALALAGGPPRQTLASREVKLDNPRSEPTPGAAGALLIWLVPDLACGPIRPGITAVRLSEDHIRNFHSYSTS